MLFTPANHGPLAQWESISSTWKIHRFDPCRDYQFSSRGFDPHSDIRKDEGSSVDRAAECNRPATLNDVHPGGLLHGRTG